MTFDVDTTRLHAGDPTGGYAERFEQDEIIARLVRLDPDLYEETYYSERALFYNPDRAAPLGVIFVAIKDRDGPNDARSRLSRAGVFRFAFQLPRAAYIDRFGLVPPRPPKGDFVKVDHDVSVLNELTPHPVYAWMGWVQILNPTRASFERVEPLLEESFDAVRKRWEKRSRAR